MLDDVLAIVFRLFGSSVVAVVDGDMALAVGGLGHERRGWGVSRGAVDWFGIVCRRF